MTTNGERGRGILSPSDREYLRNPDNYSRQASYRRRDEIAERVWNSFLDGRLLFHELDEKERQRIFTGWSEFANTPDPSDDREYEPKEYAHEIFEKIDAERGFAGFFAFLYLGLTEIDSLDFAEKLELGVRLAEGSRGREVSDFSLDIESHPRPTTDELLARFQKRQELSTDQLNRLRESDEIDDEELIQYYDSLADRGVRRANGLTRRRR